MPIPDDEELDRARVEKLVQGLAAMVKAHYLGQGAPGRPLHADRGLVFEALNGLACVVAMVVAGTAPEGVRDCVHFFGEALTQQLRKTLEDLAEMDQKGEPH
jgi:hypothetical protein